MIPEALSYLKARHNFPILNEFPLTFRTGALTKKATSLSIPIMNLKFAPVTSLAFSTARSKDWEDVITAHIDESSARTWTVLNKKLGRWTLGTGGKGKPGSVKVSFLGDTSCFDRSQFRCSLTCSCSAGSMCQCVWKLWNRRILDRCDPYVEHAVWNPAQVIQRWFSPT